MKGVRGPVPPKDGVAVPSYPELGVSTVMPEYRLIHVQPRWYEHVESGETTGTGSSEEASSDFDDVDLWTGIPVLFVPRQ